MEPCPDCEEFRTIVDPVPKHVHWCHERIAELEAELAKDEEAIRLFESENEEWVSAVARWRELKARAEKAEAEVEHWRDIASSLNEVVERQGAEVERLRFQNKAMWEMLGKPISVEAPR